MEGDAVEDHVACVGREEVLQATKIECKQEKPLDLQVCHWKLIIASGVIEIHVMAEIYQCPRWTACHVCGSY